MLCPNCKTENAQSANFCKKCGSDLRNIASVSNSSETAVSSENTAAVSDREKLQSPATGMEAQKAPKPKAGSSNSVVKVLAALVAVVALVLIVRAFLSGGATLTYVKDGELFKSGGGKAVRLTQDIFEDEIENGRIATGLGGFLQHIFGTVSRSSDGKEIVYAYDESVYINNGGKEGEKVASDATWSMISPDGSAVAYLAEDDGENELYVSRRGKKEKLGPAYIDSDFSTVAFDRKGTSIAYISYNEDDGENELYIKKIGGDKEKIDSEVNFFCSVSDDLSALLYVKSETLYYYSKKGGKEKVSDDINRAFYNPYDFKGIYFLTYTDGEDELYYFTPGKGKEKIDSEVETILNLPATTDESTSKNFREDIVIYSKQSGDGGFDIYVKKKGKDKEKLASDVMLSGYNAADEMALAISTVTKPRNIVNYAMYGTGFGGMNIEMTSYAISDDYKYFAYVDNDASGTLYVKEIDKGSDGEKIKIDEDVTYVAFSGDKVIYIKDFSYEKYEGDLHVSQVKENKKSTKALASDVNSFIVAGDGKLYYFSDYNYEKDRGTLYASNLKKNTKISDDVSVVMTAGETVTFLKDYNFEKGTGDLYLVKGNKAKRIDTDVNCLISID